MAIYSATYLPPCFRGKDNTYTVTVKAVKKSDGKVSATLAEATIKMGKYSGSRDGGMQASVLILRLHYFSS